MDDIIGAVKQTVKSSFVAPVADQYDIKKSARNRIESQVDTAIERDLTRVRDDYIQQAQIAQAELERKRKDAEGNVAAVKKAEDDFASTMEDAMRALTETIQETVQKTITEKPTEVIAQIEKAKAEEEKKSVEDSVRDHLRGFARTIPSFIMAYGDEDLTLGNFDDYTEDDVFFEVTGITEADFRFLRDGGDFTNEETGETEHFYGHLFDEVVFNDSIKEFLKKKKLLANYFDESLDEDIFDYIPPQKTNQIFTPKWVVQKMVNQLEENNTVRPKLGEKAAHNSSVVYSLDFQVTPHQLRHTYITNLIFAGVDPKTVQYLAGHENSKITMDIYAKVKYNSPNSLAAIVNRAMTTVYAN